MDIDKNDKIELNEFIDCMKVMKKWGIDIKDPEKEFKILDVNNDGVLVFDEFCDYYVKKSLK